MDVTEVILHQHAEQRRMFAMLEEWPRDDEDGLDALWKRLEILLEVHAEAEERFFYPELVRRGEGGGDADSMEEALTGADLTVVLTEWDEFTTADPSALRAIVSGRTVIDGRNCLDAAAWNRAGWSVLAMGTVPEVAPLADDLAALAPVR